MKIFLHPSLLLALGLFFWAAPAFAQEAAPSKTGTAEDAVDISAEESLEWYQETRLYVARGKAKAIKGELTIESDLLTAHAREPAAGEAAQGAKKETSSPQGNIDRLTAEGNVFIHDPKQKVYGDKAVYDTDSGIIKVTGANLKYVTASDIVTAKDSLEYHEKKKIAVARGQAIGQHKDTRVEADMLTAYFTDASNDNMAMKELHAKGHVIIVTKEGDVSRGDYAVYNTEKDIAIITDHVKLTQGDTQLAGDRAEVNFKTGQSRLLNDGSGRVRALLPSSSDKKKKAAP